MTNAQRIRVHFNSSNRTYNYLSDIEGLEVGDTVVVTCDNDSRMEIAHVTAIDVEELEGEPLATAYVVQKVDTSAITRRRRVQALERKLKKAIAEASVYDLAERLAENNPTLQALLGEIKELKS